jgi:hypothetical protein
MALLEYLTGYFGKLPFVIVGKLSSFLNQCTEVVEE